ncbi:DUF2934 domain-containing protein [Neorhizobium sp. P12A]|uniref:DUF2934 domain-containing protein n=1 Tax=Neorhizobium sp. P12A TaxID=2268027 RepID=UPI0011EDE8C4|nr:DUF2934 domain-containing protein [Neorhizobium sp. P12A]KAA0687966.1 DUF2934 domain-containing protein [Neorhizobium sp. P12A]
MIDEETRRLRAYQIWESEGRPEGRDLAHWYKAGEADFDASRDRPHFIQYSPGAAPPGSLVIKFYHSGDQIRGYVRKIAEPDEDDTIFPGEEMEPDAAFKLANSHNGDAHTPIFIELVEDVQWDPTWGELRSDHVATDTGETDDSHSQDDPAVARGRRTLAREAKKGPGRAVADPDR